MKKTLNLLMLLWVVTLAACSADEPQTITATEAYNREFAKEFGVPAAGHDFSMATTAGLKVTSKNGDHITVTAEIDGEEYLFADCHVPAGTTAIPVTIPRTVSELKLATTHGELTVATNALVNLDEIKNPTMRLAAPLPSDDGPWIAFHIEDFMKSFFEKDNSAIKYTMVNYDYYKKRKPGDKGYIFPIYWRTDKAGNKDYKVQFVSSPIGLNRDIKTTEIIFDNNQSETIPFPSLSYSPWVSSVEELTVDKKSMFGYGVEEYAIESYSTNLNNNYMIVSRGIRIEDYTEAVGCGGSEAWYLELNYGYKDSENYSVSSESPYRNIEFWDGCYYDVPLKNLNIAHHGAFQFYTTGKKFYIYDDKLEEGTPVGNFKEVSPYKAVIVGFNTAPTSPAFDTPRDYSDVAFLYLVFNGYSGGSVSTNKVYSWTIAAEDLGATDDWDFNDAVFSFSDQIMDLNTVNNNQNAKQAFAWGPRDAEPVRVITVTPKAAGGTMPIYITYTGKTGKVPYIPDGTGETADVMYSDANQVLKDYMQNLEYSEGTHIVGKELHAWLGADSYKTMVNTGETKQNLKPESVQFVIPVETQLDLKSSEWDSATSTWTQGSYIASAKNKTISGFAVLVDRENSLGVDAMNETEQGMHRVDDLVMGEGTYLIGRPDATNGEIAPQMILVNGSTWRWPQERVKISDAYPDFAAWLADPSLSWTGNYVKEKVTY